MVTKVEKIEIDTELLKRINKIVEKENTNINDVIKQGIEKIEDKTEIEIPEHLILNKDTYDPDPESMRKHAGFIKNIPPFNAVKLIRDMREGR